MFILSPSSIHRPQFTALNSPPSIHRPHFNAFSSLLSFSLFTHNLVSYSQYSFLISPFLLLDSRLDLLDRHLRPISPQSLKRHPLASPLEVALLILDQNLKSNHRKPHPGLRVNDTSQGTQCTTLYYLILSGTVDAMFANDNAITCTSTRTETMGM